MKNIFKKFILFTSISSISFSLKGTLPSKTGFPKWDGLIDLQCSGLPTPTSMFTPPYSTIEDIQRTITEFTNKINGELIALRPDGKNGIGKSPPGITFKALEKINIIKKIKEWTSEGYGITIVETYNRFDYDFCCNILLDDDGSFLFEFVGPGFDGGDLNKAILQPTMTVKSHPESPIFIYSDPISGEPNIESLEHLYCRLNIEGRAPTEEEINTRLLYITSKLLPDMGVSIEKTITATKTWLQQNQCARLLEKINPRTIISMDDLQTLVYSASLYANSLLRTGKKIHTRALTAHKYNNKIVFFGTYDSQKWGDRF